MVDVNNLGEVKLPICTTPIVRENFLAMEYSVFQAYERDLTPVLCNYYINIVSAQDKRVQFSHLHEDKWLVKEKIMHQHHMTWHREMFEDNQDELINIIQKLIANGYYLIGNYNSFYIKAKPAYQCYETNTVYLIYGFNQKTRIFYAIGKTSSNTFEPYEIGYDEYMQAVFNRENGLFNLNFLKFNDDCVIKADIKKIHNGIYDYVNSKRKEDGPVPEGEAKNYRYGMNCYRDFLKSLAIQHEYRCYIEPVSYAVFLEHHILMQKRIDYLISAGIVDEKEIGSEYHRIVEQSKCIYSLCLQYNTSFDPELIRQIYNGVSTIIDNEQQLLNRLLERLREYYLSRNADDN